MDKLVGITVNDLLNLKILKKAKVLSGKEGCNRIITKINVMEVPDILDWVGPGEFLLTTAYSMKDNLNGLNQLIPKLNEKKLAGIGIKTKRYIKEIPEEIIKKAQGLNFPIIEIPHDLAYSEIIFPAFTQIIHQHTNTLLKIDQLHNKLMNVMIEGGSLKEIAEAIYESINNTVAIKENISKKYVISCREEIRSDIEKFLLEENFHSGKNTVIGEQNIDCICIPICIRGTNYGDLFIWEDERKLTEVELTVIKSSISIIALDLVKKISIFEIESKHKIEFLNDLLSGDVMQQKKAMERSQFFNFDKKLSYVVLVIAINRKTREIKYTPNNVDFVHQLNRKLVSILERTVRYRNEKIIYGNKSDRIILLFGIEKEKKEKEIKKRLMEFCDQILFYAKEEGFKEYISIGIGRKYDEIYELYKSLRQATKASEAIEVKKDYRPVHYDDLGIYRILSYKELKPELIQFYKETLEPLALYDKEKGSELVKTLEMYFMYGGNLKKISENMYTHYNTIIYRIQRIKDIMGIDFENYNDRLNIQIALKISKMLDQQ